MYAIGVLKAWSASRAARSRKSMNHTAHAIATLATLGLWLPVWFVLALVREGWMSGYNWNLSGNPYAGIDKINRLEVTPEQMRRLCRR